MNLMQGVLLIDKPPGATSHDVVDDLRRILHERRIGHTGTLDPFATGLLVILVGRATRVAQFLSGLEKEYEAVIRLGFATDTGDITGKPIRINEDESRGARVSNWTAPQIEAALAKLRGDIDQVPPMYSAKKQGGRKLYELARRGEEVERKPVQVCIHSFERLNPVGDLVKDNLDGTFDLGVRVACSAGTYIRTLAEDFGKHLGVGAHVAELRRTRVGHFSIQDASTIADVKVSVGEEALGKVMLPNDVALSRLPFVDLSDDDVKRVQNGMPVQVSEAAWANGERVRIRDHHGDLFAVGEFDAAAGLLRPSVVLARDNL
jgi:tRNA pseudouridine55 synthase